MDFEINKHPYRAVTEVPSIIPIIAPQDIPRIESQTSEKDFEFKIFTTVEQNFRDIILAHLDSNEKWRVTEYEGLNGYYLF